MKNSIIALFGAAAAGWLAGGGHLDLTPEGNPDRVLTGTVELSSEAALPADAVVVIRILDPSRANVPPPTAVLGEVTAKPPEMSQPPTVLGEQTIRNPGQAPVAYRIEYTATDEQLRRGLNIEARVAFGGRVRFSNRNGFAITLLNVSDPHTIVVNPVER